MSVSSSPSIRRRWARLWWSPGTLRCITCSARRCGGVSRKRGSEEGPEMEIFLDTANLEEIERWLDCGVLDGVTTNPSIMLKDGGYDLKRRAGANPPPPLPLLRTGGAWRQGRRDLREHLRRPRSR